MIEPGYPNDATPLNQSEMDGLLLTHITNRAELDRWEQDNINEAMIWIESQKPSDIMNEHFIKLLHK